MEAQTISLSVYMSLINICFKRIEGECNFEAFFLSDKEIIVLEDKAFVGMLNFDTDTNQWVYDCTDPIAEKIVKMWLSKYIKDTSELTEDYLHNKKAQVKELKPELKKPFQFGDFTLVRAWNIERAN